MFSKVKMLIWERWRRTRWAVAVACLLTFAEQLMSGFGFITPGGAVSLGGTGTAILLFVLLCGYCELRELDLRFPERLFRLPVRTATLIGTHLGFGVVVLALPVLIRVCFVMLFSGSASNRLAGVSFLWNGFLLLETAYMVLQTLSWMGGVRAYVMCLVPSLTFLFALPFLATWFDLPLNTNAVCWIIIVLCGIISFWNVSANRHGAWTKGRQWAVPFPGVFRKKPPRPFSSALEAQIWFESRQTGYLFPVAVLCIVVPLLVAAILMKPSFPVLLFFSIAFWATIVLSEIAGLLAFGVYHRDHVSGASGFWLRRPIDTRVLATARQRAMMRSIKRVLVILTAFALVLIGRDWAFGTLDVTQLLPVKWAQASISPLEFAAMVLFAVCCLALIHWTLLRMPMLMIIITQIYWAGVNVARSWHWETMFTYLNVLIFAGVSIAFCVAKRRNLISKAALVCSTCAFAVTVAFLWVFPRWTGSKGLLDWLIGTGGENLNQSQSIFLISLAVLPLIPIVATPLIVERMRHRHGIFQY